MSWRSAGLGLVVLGGVGVLAALFLPWSWAGPSTDPPSGLMWAAILALGPVASAVMVPLSVRHSPRAPLTAAVAALLAGGLATVVLLDIPAEHGIGAGGPVAVLGCAAAVLGWLLRIPADGETPRRAPITVTTVFVLLTALGAVPAVGWYTEGRFVRHTTAEALGTELDSSPARLDRYQWKAPAEPFRLLVGPVMAGRHVILTQGKGVRALDAVTGRPQWSYQRDDVRRDNDLAGVAAVLGGRITVLSYRFYGGALVVALDTAHGNVLWQRRVPLNPGSGMPRLVDGHEVVLLDATYLGGELVALDGSDGTPLWSWDTGRREDPCETADTSAAVAGSVVALVVSCHGRPDADLVIALSVADGRQRWTWRPPARSAGLKLPIRAADDRFWVTYSQISEAALLDADTGAMTAAHALPAGDLRPYRLPLISDGVLVYADEPAVGVDLVTGDVRWRLRTDEPAGRRPIDAVSHDGTAYLLLTPAEGTRAAPMLLAIDIATGQVRERRSYDPGRCGAECSSDDAARILVGSGRLLVGSRERDGFWLRGIG